MDLIYIALLIGLFGLSFALIPAFSRLRDQRPDQQEQRK